MISVIGFWSLHGGIFGSVKYPPSQVELSHYNPEITLLLLTKHMHRGRLSQLHLLPCPSLDAIVHPPHPPVEASRAFSLPPSRWERKAGSRINKKKKKRKKKWCNGSSLICHTGFVKGDIKSATTVLFSRAFLA